MTKTTSATKPTQPRGTPARRFATVCQVVLLAEVAACSSSPTASRDGGAEVGNPDGAVESVVISAAAPRPRTGTWSVNYWTWPDALKGTETLVAGLKPTFMRVGGYNNDVNMPDPFSNDQLDTMVAYARAIGAEPILQVPLLLDTTGAQPTGATAAAMIRYANVTKGYGIKYFSVGNEPDLYAAQGLPSGPSQPARPGYSPTDYCADATAYVAQMKSVDPSIHIVGPDLSQPRGNWLTPILESCGDLFDIIAIHRYPLSSAISTIARAASDAAVFRAAVAAMREIMTATGQGEKPLAITETNIAYNATTTVLDASPGTVPSGLWLADNLGASLDLGLWTLAVWDICDEDRMSLGLIGTPPSHTPRPEYYAYALFADHPGPTLVDVTAAPQGVNAYATRNQAGSATSVIAINWNSTPTALAFQVTGLPKTPAQAIYVMPALSMAAIEIPDDGSPSAWIYGDAQHDLGVGPQPLSPGLAGASPSTSDAAASSSTDLATDTGGGAGVSCDAGMPGATGTLSIADNYVVAGSLHGYASAWTWVGTTSNGMACATPTCTAPGSLLVTPIVEEGAAPLTAQVVSCAPAFAPSALCTAGTVAADPTYLSVAGTTTYRVSSGRLV